MIHRLHGLLQANAAAFSKFVHGEQRRMATLFSETEGLPLADRLMMYITGVETNMMVRDLQGAVGQLL